MDFIIKPRYNRAQNAVMFETERVNAFQRAEYMSTRGFFQSMFNVYGFMQLTRKLTYKIWYPTGTPLVWQAMNSCTWNPTKTLSFGSTEITPTEVKINEELCSLDTATEVFKAWREFNGGAVSSLTDAGVAMTNELTRTMVANATLGAQAQLVAGQVFAAEAVSGGTAANITTAFNATKNVVVGYVKAAMTAGGKLNDTTNLITATDITAGVYTADVLDLYDAYVAQATQKLKNAINIGGALFGETPQYPLWVVSESIFNAVLAKKRQLDASPLQNNVRIKSFDAVYNGANVTYYKIDNTVVIPEFTATNFAQYTTKQAHFAYLTISGVIQFGASFTSIPDLETQNIAIRVQQGERNQDYGVVSFLAHALQAAAFNDADYIVGSCIVE